MLTLYHQSLSPFCRQVRLSLAEKGLEFDLVFEKTHQRRPEFLALNPAGTVPVLVYDGHTLCDNRSITEYLEEKHPLPNLLGQTAEYRAEVRRLIAWFNEKFHKEVTVNLLDEKYTKRFLQQGQSAGGPSSGAIRAGHHNIHTHLQYISYLMERRNWLAGETFSLADIAAAAHLSSLDYLGDVSWDEHREAKQWYAKIKSRPSFRALLADHIAGMPPPKTYANLDF